MTTNLNANGTGEEKFVDELLPGTPLLHGQYVIEEYLNSGGFGITYLAKDSLHRHVVIKECFPSAFCRRSETVVGVRSRAHASEFKSIVSLFVQEARNLARLKHPNIVGVHQVFEDNDTAYMALDFVDGRDLLDVIEDSKSDLAPEQVHRLLVKLLHAVKFIHSEGVLHRDISPDNILVTAEGEPVLIDFGAARETATRASRVLTAMRVVKDGYSPQEFYLSGSDQFPCSDLYALAATIYHLITDTMPPNAQDRLAAVAGNDPDPYVPAAVRARGYNRTFLQAIDKALNIFPRDRLQTAAEWLEILSSAPQSEPKKEAAVKLAVDNDLEATIHNLVESDPDRAEQAQLEEVLRKVDERQAAASRPHRRSDRDDRPAEAQSNQEGAAEPQAAPAPRRPIRNTAEPKRSSARPAIHSVRVLEDDEPPAISLKEAQREKVKSRSFARRAVATALLTCAVVWYQYGAWKDTIVAGVAAATSLNPAVEDAAISFVPLSSTVKIDLPFAVDANDPARVFRLDRAAPSWIQPGQQIRVVNGVPVQSLDDIERIVAPANDLEPGQIVDVIFGVQSADGASSFVQTLELPVVRETTLPSGDRLHSMLSNGSWTTTVVEPLHVRYGSFQRGDELVSLRGGAEMIDSPDTLIMIAERELAAGTETLNFVVRRGGEMHFATVPHGPTTN